MSTVDNTLTERGTRYGAFEDNAEITQHLKHVLRQHPGWGDLSLSQAEALEMIAHKIGRILNGDPNYIDSWHDIAGYACLVEKNLQREQTGSGTGAAATKPAESPGAKEQVAMHGEDIKAFISKFLTDDAQRSEVNAAQACLAEVRTMFPNASVTVTFVSEESGLTD